jgi:hypothetical protein
MLTGRRRELPHDFLLDPHDVNPEATRAALEQQAAGLDNPGDSTSSRAHSSQRVCRASPTPSAHSASLA